MARERFVSAGQRHHKIRIEEPDGAPSSDGEGAYTQAYKRLADVWAAVEYASSRGDEHSAGRSSAVITTARLTVTIPYLEGVTTECRVIWNGKTLNVDAVRDVDTRRVQLELACYETEEADA